MTLQNEKFEELIAEQLSRQLEPQRGRAAAAVRAQIAAEQAERAAAERQARAIAGGSRDSQSWARKEVSRRSLFFWTGVPSLVAAALALAVTLHFTGTMPGGTGGTIDPGTTAGGSNVIPEPAGERPDSRVTIPLSTNQPGVRVVNDVGLQDSGQPRYQPKPGQWMDPVDHMYRLADQPKP
jgi:hypothetical protein